MSHVMQVRLVVRDLDALNMACEALGTVEYDQTATHFTTYLGAKARCDSGVIHVKGNSKAYQIGIQSKADGTYDLLTDFYGGGAGLVEAVGRDACKLKQEYAAAVVTKNYAEQGNFAIDRQWSEDGLTLFLTATKIAEVSSFGA